MEDFEVVCRGLYRALCIREKYMQQSMQRFPKTPSQYLRAMEGEPWKPSDIGPGTSRHPRGFFWLQYGAGLRKELWKALAQASCLVSQWWGVPPTAWGGGARQAWEVWAGSLIEFSFWCSVHPASEERTGSL